MGVPLYPFFGFGVVILIVTPFKPRDDVLRPGLELKF